MERDELRDVLGLALRAGQLLLENGANTARVEETAVCIGKGLGAEALDIYATPSGIIGSIRSGEEHRTRVLRVVNSTLMLGRVAAVIDLSRRAATGQAGRAEVGLALERIAVQPPAYGHWLTLAAVAAACASLAALFGAGPREVAATAMAAGLAQQARMWLTAIRLNRLLLTSAVAAVAAGSALSLSRLLQAPQPASAMLASVLLLVPGVVMVSAVVDLFRGDTLAGISRGVAATLTLISIAVGIWLVLLVSGISIPLESTPPPSLPLAVALAFVATVGFAVAFDAPPRALWGCGLIGALAYVARQGALGAGLPPEPAIFCGGLAVGILGELLARRRYLPASIFTIPGFIPLVPGALGFRTVLVLVERDYPTGVASLFQAILLTGALASGLATVQVLARMGRVEH